ncbi:response regulator [Desulfurivibrio alkaliphilus]|uniref:Response regulator receiver protein n=1 Tax=Desulfurivibrio alkaliphilus (strain DSM 19089 / UNIQEM U267 / AHT2) TaxID=589865 RepID=D6Z0E4_DESAT|nr:response regulator [Desulfurivibrio alkaliphilus]ADH87177.1 response regulator receiver protein [Desulfurivibrio alkaliphilus AHT 2]
MFEPLQLLIVDDEPDFREALAQRLRFRGFGVRTAAGCHQALAALAEQPVEVVILDVMLPDVDGLDCLVRIKKRWPNTGVIMLSGHASISAGMQGIAAGASEYCLKPVELGELVEKIHIAHAEARARG